MPCSYLLIVLLLICARGEASKNESIGRRDFPKGFIFGTASSAYQYEGAAKLDGRGQSIWDTFVLYSGRIADGSSGDVAVDQYHLYKVDMQARVLNIMIQV
ncbi:hypothetical protein H6P81_010167 [Aristolochia fimbriata]|uniref:Uncharacterized protein n=1 Tax=Aristolochia fimbriata TaxID=158543 RepID=A0AAV7EN01_ARIFI|nr:hypothetical protein H6P81_010167 [Aristolochia fimbriata]